MAWKESFDAELLALRKAAGETDVKEKKLTGRELFLSDVTLAESDLKFLADQGETIRVDESLFQVKAAPSSLLWCLQCLFHFEPDSLSCSRTWTTSTWTTPI